MSNRPAVAVGIDGSEQAFNAATWALEAATLRHTTLDVVHSWAVPLPPIVLGHTPVWPADDRIRDAARVVLDDAVTRLQTTASDTTINGVLYPGNPSAALLDAAERAALVVVGSSGLDRVAEFILGSVTQQIVTHAACPVAVVPSYADIEPGPAAGRVVVGIDGSELSVDATRLAFEEASLRRVGLTLLHAWNAPSYDTAGVVMPDTLLLEAAHSDELRAMAETVAGLAATYPDVEVNQLLRQGRPAKVLADASRGATLVVVGSRGHGGFASMLLGSTSRSLLHHARCPVLVVRPGTGTHPVGSAR
ncbi:MAG: universal stress protein [Actinomycetia bacterium]|nr:universal stress protein [Actinomycetes bacterium]